MSTEYDQRPQTLNLLVRRGDALNTDLTLTVGCSGTAAFSLAGYTLTSDIVSLVTGNVVQTASATIVNAGAGVANVTVSEADIEALPIGSYGWSLRWTAPTGAERTPYAGLFEVSR
jgi:hypothetical protein